MRWTSTAWSGCLRGLESGAIRIVARDLTEPSPLALEVLSARPYAYLDDAPLEERRTQAVMSRRWLDPDTASDLGRLDPEAIARVRAEAWPEAANRDELHDALVWLGFVTDAEVRAGAGWREWLAELAREKRVAQLGAPGGNVWIAAERLPHFQALWPTAALQPAIVAPAGYAERQWSAPDALIEILRGRLEGQGPVTHAALASPLALDDGGDSRRTGCARGRGLRDAWAIYAGRRKGRMVRTRSAGADQSLHA